MLVALWIVAGLLVGGFATLLTPAERNARTVTVTLTLGVLGALLGGFGGRALGLYPSIFRGVALGAAIAGAIVILAVYNAAFARRTVDRA